MVSKGFDGVKKSPTLARDEGGKPHVVTGYSAKHILGISTT